MNNQENHTICWKQMIVEIGCGVHSDRIFDAADGPHVVLVVYLSIRQNSIPDNTTVSDEDKETGSSLLSPINLFSIDHLFSIPSGELNSASIPILLSFVFFI